MGYQQSRKVCQSTPSIGYYSGFGGIELKKFTPDDLYAYVVIGVWTSNKSYRRLKVESDSSGTFIRYGGEKCYLGDFIRMG